MLRRVKEVAVQAGLQNEFDLKTFRPTFERRRTDLPKGIPVALTPELVQGNAKAAQWIGFVERLRLENVPDLPQVGMAIRQFVEPVLIEDRTARSWPAGGSWHA